MARMDTQAERVTSIGDDSGISFLHIKAGGAASKFGVLAIDITDSNGAVTTYYYWPNSSGVLRYGSTAPTSSTQDTAGNAV
jgi:hypothetical protein